MGKDPYMIPVSEDEARRIADIIGPFSAAARALKDVARRRAEGEDVMIYRSLSLWLVGPPPSARSAAEKP